MVATGIRERLDADHLLVHPPARDRPSAVDELE
jgi:hypothetical protein